MKKVIATLCLFLSGCATTVPVERHFPDAPTPLMSPCENLKKLDENTTKLSDVLDTVVDNYSLYHECSIKVKSWIEWYNSQKENFNSVK